MPLRSESVDELRFGQPVIGFPGDTRRGKSFGMIASLGIPSDVKKVSIGGRRDSKKDR